jgi:hypothetical protein
MFSSFCLPLFVRFGFNNPNPQIDLFLGPFLITSLHAVKSLLGIISFRWGKSTSPHWVVAGFLQQVSKTRVISFHSPFYPE